MKHNLKSAQIILKSGGVGVLATDTLYGIVGSALSKKAVTRIYRLRKRNAKKPMIILIAGVSGLAQFGITLTPPIRAVLSKLWPGPVSVLLPCDTKAFAYLHRGTYMLAFRVPKSRSLRALLTKTGPLVAPSANLEGFPPAETIEEAYAYFDTTVDFYVDGGMRKGTPSTLIEIKR